MGGQMDHRQSHVWGGGWYPTYGPVYHAPRVVPPCCKKIHDGGVPLRQRIGGVGRKPLAPLIRLQGGGFGMDFQKTKFRVFVDREYSTVFGSGGSRKKAREIDIVNQPEPLG